jgi:hypothetical protein
MGTTVNVFFIFTILKLLNNMNKNLAYTRSPTHVRPDFTAFTHWHKYQNALG